ncbi:hypothetical protein Tco_0804777 [Tanacetum coccineum]|uniref:Transposase (Putative), gypsy type n=1 Tax=Tanacetum coccineum TaxID=301880 RepID=A0ABQ5A587_9ASTR
MKSKQESEFEWKDQKTMLHIGKNVAWWSNIVGELVGEFLMHYSSWDNIEDVKKAGPSVLSTRGRVRLGFEDKDNLQSSAFPVSPSNHVMSLSKNAYAWPLVCYGVCHHPLGFPWAGTVAGPWAFIIIILYFFCFADTCVESPRWTVKIVFSSNVSFRIPRQGMSGSEPGEMAPESSKAVVLPKFDMHIYTSELTLEELKTAINEYCIPIDLHPCLPPLGMTMNRLPSRVILFEIHCMSLDIRPTVSLFQVFYKLCKQGYWFPFENKTGGRAKKCFKEVTTSLKGWKKKFFLLDCRAISDAMPWRHGDTNLHDDFPTNYDKGEVARMSEFLVPLRPPPPHLLYVCGLTMTCRHPKLRYNIKDPDTNVIDMDTFLKLPTSTRTINLEKPDAKIAAAREKKEQQNLAKVKAKRAGAIGGEAGVEVGKKPATATAPEIAKDTSHAERVIVDLSGNTCVSTPPVKVNHPSPTRERHDTHVSPTHDAHSPQSSHHGQYDVAQGELLKRHEQLNREYVDLRNRNDAHLVELDHLRLSLRKVEKIRSLEKDLEPRTHQLVAAEEKIGVLEREKLALSAQMAQAEADRKKLV